MKLAFEFDSLEEFVGFLRLLRPDVTGIDKALATETARLKAATSTLQAAIDRQPQGE